MRYCTFSLMYNCLQLLPIFHSTSSMSSFVRQPFSLWVEVVCSALRMRFSVLVTGMLAAQIVLRAQPLDISLNDPLKTFKLCTYVCFYGFAWHIRK